METSLIKKYIEEIRAIPIDHWLSDDALVALMHLHLSLLTMLVAPALEDKYGCAKEHREAVEKLFLLCRKRSASNQSLMRRSRLTPAMYRACYMPDRLFDDRKYDSCLRRSFTMMDEWRRRQSDVHPLDEKARLTEYGILRSILETLLYRVEADKVDDNDLRYLQHRMEAWSSEMEADGCWNGLSDYEAMRRIDIMAEHAGINGDRRFDRQIAQSLACYFDKITGSEHIDAHTLFYLYWTMRWENSPAECSKLDRLAAQAEHLAGSSPHGSEEWLWHAAVVVDRACATIQDDLKRQMLACSA